MISASTRAWWAAVWPAGLTGAGGSTSTRLSFTQRLSYRVRSPWNLPRFDIRRRLRHHRPIRHPVGAAAMYLNHTLRNELGEHLP